VFLALTGPSTTTPPTPDATTTGRKR
jgi:hypothetical protein